MNDCRTAGSGAQCKRMPPLWVAAGAELLGGGGAFEAMASLLSLKDNQIPPTINLNDPDEECDLNYTANNSIEKNIEYVMSNSFGFGGHNAVLVFSKQ